ncbi:MAG: hypothetical protein IKE90_03210 [Bacilli bacterium]|nr:hypothetical protein [Bacilli bacterium]
MKEAIANAGVFNLVIIFVVILLSFFIGSLGYSKAFKVKNKIVEEIEKDEGYDDVTEDSIEEWLGEMGYRMNTGFSYNECPEEVFNGQSGEVVNKNSNYQYCVYKFDNCTSMESTCIKSNVHYRVIAYMYFDVPIINNLIKIPVKGETKSFTTLNS